MGLGWGVDITLAYTNMHCYTVSAQWLLNNVSGVWNMASYWLALQLVWLASLNIGWGMLKLQCILGKLQCILDSCDQWEFLPLFHRPLTVPCPAMTAGDVLRDCDTVYVKYVLVISVGGQGSVVGDGWKWLFHNGWCCCFQTAIAHQGPSVPNHGSAKLPG